MIPILVNHDRNNVIGEAKFAGDNLCVKFNGMVMMTRQGVAEMFGGAGMRITESRTLPCGTVVVEECEILEFSVCA